MKQKKSGQPDTAWRPVIPGLDRHIRRRVRVFAGCLAVVCFGGLLARLFVLQLLDPDGYAARAADQQLRDTVVPAPRGEIYSSDGTLLAASETCWTIRAAPRELADELVEPAARALSEILEIDEAETLEKFSRRSSNDCLLRRRVDRETADAVRLWCEENGADGIQIRQDTRRIYPEGDFMGCLLGFTDVDNAGLWGLELEYDEVLTGENGRVLTAKNAWGYDMPEEYRTLIDAVPGSSLTLTIDANIQHMLESALSAAVEEHNVSARGVGIVMDVQTGAILAMTTKPDYDPNDPRTIVDEGIRAQVNALTGEERSQALQTAQQAQWRNKAISDLYEPGSVFKLITCAAALDTGAVTPDSQFVCAGKIKVSGTTFRCANGHIHGLETLAQGLAASCNPCFIQVGARLGKEAFCDYFAAFGLREATGIDLPGEIKRSEYYTADRMGPVPDFGPWQLPYGSLCFTGRLLRLQHTRHNIFFLVGNHTIHLEPRPEYFRQFGGGQHSYRHFGGPARVVPVQLCQAHTVGHRQPPAGAQPPRQIPHQPGRVRKMGEGVVHHAAVAVAGALQGLNVTTDHPDGRQGVFLGDLGHLGGNIHRQHLCGAPLPVKGEEHPGAAGHVQHPHPGHDAGGVQNGIDLRCVHHQVLFPAGGQLVEKGRHLLPVDGAAVLHTFPVHLVYTFLSGARTAGLSRCKSAGCPKWPAPGIRRSTGQPPRDPGRG